MKATRITFWVTTGLIFLNQGLMPIFTVNMPEAVEAMAHLGYPSYFPLMLAIFKLFGGIVLIVPYFKGRVKEWAYACFAVDFIAAAISIWVVDGFGGTVFIPLVAFAILAASYLSYHKITGPSSESRV